MSTRPCKMALPTPKGQFRFGRNVCNEGVFYSLLPSTLSDFAAIVSVCNQRVSVERHPLSREGLLIPLQPEEFALSRVERRPGNSFVGDSDHQVLLFRKRKRFERTKDARFNDDFQLLGHPFDCSPRRWREYIVHVSERLSETRKIDEGDSKNVGDRHHDWCAVRCPTL